MFRFIVTTLLLLFSAVSFGQATLYSENFEPPYANWSETGDLSPNSWNKGTCAGNGTSFPGFHALYISQGGGIPGCGVTGQDQYTYTNSPAGVKQAIAYTTIVGNCASSLQATFDYLIQGVAAQDYAELIYSTNGGGSWTAVGGNLASTPTWTTTTIALPGSLDFSTFLIGIRFTYDDATINGNPIAIDNFKVTGTDNVNPVILCPASITQVADASCQVFAADYTKSMNAVSDNCTDSVDIFVSQSVLFGSLLPVTPGNSTTITLTAQDEAGNTSQCSFILNVIDATNPAFTLCPPNQSIYVNSSCVGVVGDYMSLATASDNCPGILTFTQSPPVGQIVNGQNVVTTVTITATDPFGNSATCLLNATTIDTILPTILCPSLQTLYADVNCQVALFDYTLLAFASDNCVSASGLTVTQSPLPGTSISADQIITLTVNGGIPSTPQSCVFTVDFIDSIRPNVICPVPSAIYVNSVCDATIPNYLPGLSWTDNCTSLASQMTFTQTPVAGTITSNNQLVYLTAIDAAGNPRACSFVQQVFDTIKPVLTCPANQIVAMNASCFSVLADYTSLVTNVENCFFTTPVSISQSPVIGTTINTVTTVTISGLDESGNTGVCSFTVTPIDGIAPTISCPGATTVNTNAGCTYVLPNVIPLTTANDNCTPLGSLVYTQTPVAGTVLATGAHTISITVADQTGNSANCSYQLTVVDQTAPILNCPLAQNVSVGASCTANLPNYLSLVTASDNCTAMGALTITQSPASGTSISGNTLVTITVLDAASNSSTCSFFAVTIDNTDPVLTCQATYNVAINSSCQYPIPDLSGTVTGTDNCSSLANMTISQNPIAGSTGSSMTAVLITLTDEQGNNATCITMLTPLDTEPPVITCPSPAPINNGANCNYTLTNFGSTALVLDNCSGYSIQQTPSPGTVLQTGSQVIQLEVMDAGGNLAQCSFTLDVNENVAPTIVCPSNISTCDPLVSYTDPTFNDNCFAFMAQSDVTGFTSGDVFPIGTTTLSYTVTDSSSNSQTCSFQVTVLDFPSAASILVDTISLCQVTSTVVEAIPATSGTGEWTLLSGQGTFNNQFANLTGVNNIGYGTNVLVWTISSASCGNTSDTLILLLSQTPLPASTQDTVIACGASSLQLTANVPLYGIGTWTTDLGAAISDIHLPTAVATNLGAGWNQFIWTIVNGSCPATADTMHVFAVPSAQINQSDTAVCAENGTLLLNGTVPIVGQTGSWIFVSGSGTIDAPSLPTTTVSNFGLGVNILVYIMVDDNSLCPTTTDSLQIVSTLCNEFQPIFPTMITPNFDGKNDLFVIDYLEIVYPKCAVTIFNRWGSIVFESIGYQDPWDGTYKGEDLPMGTYFYKIELNDGSGTEFNGPISILH